MYVPGASRASRRRPAPLDGQAWSGWLWTDDGVARKKKMVWAEDGVAGNVVGYGCAPASRRTGGGATGRGTVGTVVRSLALIQGDSWPSEGASDGARRGQAC